MNKDSETKMIFNGDTPSGRARWVPWLRSLELGMDEWAWAMMQGKVPPHGKVKTIMEKEEKARTEDEKKELEKVLEAASKGRDARHAQEE